MPSLQLLLVNVDECPVYALRKLDVPFVVVPNEEEELECMLDNVQETLEAKLVQVREARRALSVDDNLGKA